MTPSGAGGPVAPSALGYVHRVNIVRRITALPGLAVGSVARTRRSLAGSVPDRQVPVRLRGRGPVVLVGGFCTTEDVLAPMRDWLGRLGYTVLTHTEDAGMGCGARSAEAVAATVRRAADRDRRGAGVALVGYSRGGQFARVTAADPTLPVRALVTLGTPFDLFRLGLPVLVPALLVAAAGTLGAAGLATGSCLFGACCATYRAGLRGPVRVPFTSVYSRGDGMVPWRASLDPVATNVEVGGSHLDLLETRPARHAVAEALARTGLGARRSGRRNRMWPGPHPASGRDGPGPERELLLHRPSGPHRTA